MTPRHYVFTLLFIPALLIGLYAGAIYAIDPYGFYHLQTDTINTTAYAPMAKAHIIRNTHPKTVIVGSSRLVNAMDAPDIYNAAIKGARIQDQAAMAVHSIQSGATHIIWGLDFFAFNANMQMRSDFTTGRLYQMDDTQTPQSDWETLFTISSLEPAMRKLVNNPPKEEPSKHALNSILRRLYFPTPNRQYAFNNDTDDTFKTFHNTLKFIHDKGAKTTLFIPPIHADLLTVIYQTGLYLTYVTWKNTIHDVAAINGLSVYDFTQIDPISTTQLDDDSNPYWKDLSHFKPNIGNAVLSELIGGTKDPTVAGFYGHALTPISINHLESRLRDYQCDHPENINAIRTAITKADLGNRLIPPIICP